MYTAQHPGTAHGIWMLVLILHGFPLFGKRFFVVFIYIKWHLQNKRCSFKKCRVSFPEKA
ncbi:hypothetical protein D1156_08960 [Neglecta sp. X58]|nr:hypothetical protein [Neglectibacter sp. X58]